MDLLRPVLYKTVTKCTIALAGILLWDKFLNGGHLSALRDGGFVAGTVLLAAAWFHYLHLDGLRIIPDNMKKPKKKRRRLFSGDIMDYADEHITNWDELSDDELSLCGLLSSLLSGILFLVPALIALLLS